MNIGRDILRHSRYARNEARELLQSIFVSELLHPSKEFWLVSPWLNDITVVDDAAGAFAPLRSESGRSELTLSSTLVHMAEAGTVVHVVTRPEQSEDFRRALTLHCTHSKGRERIHLEEVPNLHTKGLVGDDYRVIGSMNFTFSGIELNDEALRFDRDPSSVARVRLEFERQYGADSA